MPLDSFRVRILGRSDPSRSGSLRLDMIRLLTHQYRYPEAVVDRRFDSSDYLFLLYRDRELHGFCTCTFHTLNTAGGSLPSAYLGIMAASPSIQNTGIILKTMDAMTDTLRREQQSRDTGFLIWGTTATPSSISIFRRYFTRVSPDLAGNLLPEHQEAARAMKSCLTGDKPDHANHPLVVRGLLPRSAYTASEEQRMNAILKRKPGNLIRSLDIRHESGDRLILIGKLA